MRITDFGYALPAELIAQQPLHERDSSRMLIVERKTKQWRDSTFKDFPAQLNEGDVLVLNNTRVISARLRGHRSPSGGSVELLLLREIGEKTWEALTRPARRLLPDDLIFFEGGGLKARVIYKLKNGVCAVEFQSSAPLDKMIDQVGEPPLPPYIKRDVANLDQDRERYQTVYAAARGAIAAPTAGLHFTLGIIEAIKARGVIVVEITLHVGYGTFEPVRVAQVNQHQVRSEWFSIGELAAKTINQARKRSRRIVTVGTTTTRALESASGPDGYVVAQTGLSNLTIVPGYTFRCVNALLTNFHLPQSSLLLLVCAFAGRKFILDAYEHAVRKRYRFYSYGDCMFIT